MAHRATRAQNKSLRITPAKERRYVAKLGGFCPFCGYDTQLSWLSFGDSIPGALTQRKQCPKCKRTWEDIYKLHAVVPR
jgi:hypothetical protein